MSKLKEVFEELECNNESLELVTLRDLVICALKGLASYIKEVNSLGKKDRVGEEVFLKIYSKVMNDKMIEEDLLTFIREIGKVNLRYVQLLNIDNKGYCYISKIINYIKEEKISYLFIIAGLNHKNEDKYYLELIENIPKDVLILTFGDIKNKFNNFNFGNIGEVPRLIDIGQCKDVYIVIKILLALSDAFGCSIGELPVITFFSWRESKCLCSLLTLLYINNKNIYVQPSVLTKELNLKTISKVKDDLREILGVSYKSYP